MKYSRDLFVDNVNYSTKYGYEPELTIKTKDSEFFVIAYANYVEISYESNEAVRLNKIEDIFDYIDFDDVIEITGDIDYTIPITSQSIVINGELWFNVVTTKAEIKKYKKQHATFRAIGIVSFLAVFIYFLITVLNCETFDINAIIACSVFIGSTVLFCILFTVFDIKRNKLISKYYGEVEQTDREKAYALLEKIYIVDKNEYDFYDILRCDTEDVVIPQILKLLVKGKKIHIDLYKPIKTIEQEIINNKEKHTDEEFNDFIFELVKLLENNLCDI